MSVGVLVALGSAPFEAAVLSALDAERTHVVRRCVDIADLRATAASGQADVAVVSTLLPRIDRDAVEAIRRDGVGVVGVVERADDLDAGVLRSLGVSRIAVVGGTVDGVESTVLSEADARPLDASDSAEGRGRRPHHRSEDGRRTTGRNSDAGRLIAVWGPTGAPGRTVVALGLAAAIADLGADALVIDADVYGGAIAQAAGVLDEASGLLAATRAANTGSLDVEALRRRCLRLGERLVALTGLPRADRWVEANASSVRAVLDTARLLVPYTVVDCGFSLEVDEEVMYDTRAPRRNGATLEVLERADTVLAVGSADPVGLSRLIRAVADLVEAVPGRDPLVVVNRVRNAIGWSPDDIAAVVSRTTDVQRILCIPNDPAACDRALLAGRTLLEAAPDAPLARAMRRLASELTGLPGPSRRRRWRPSRGRP